MNYPLAILGMAAITLACRATFYLLGERIVFPPLARDALSFVPVAVLSAITVPLILFSGGDSLNLSWRSPWLVGGVAAIAIAWFGKRRLATIAGSLAVFFVWRFLVAG